MVGDHVVHLAVPRERELERDPKTMRRRRARAQSSHSGRRAPHAPELVIVLSGLQRDVVAEPLRLLVRVGMTPDVDKQRGVVHIRSSLLVEPDPLGKPQSDQTLPQHVLHRLPKAEIDAERERGDELRQADVPTIGPVIHTPTLSGPPSIRPSSWER